MDFSITDYLHGEEKGDKFLPYTVWKLNSKWIEDLNAKDRILKLWEDKMDNVCDLRVGEDLIK